MQALRTGTRYDKGIGVIGGISGGIKGAYIRGKPLAMMGLLWLALMIAALVGIGWWINKSTTKSKKKRA